MGKPYTEQRLVAMRQPAPKRKTANRPPLIPGRNSETRDNRCYLVLKVLEFASTKIPFCTLKSVTLSYRIKQQRWDKVLYVQNKLDVNAGRKLNGT